MRRNNEYEKDLELAHKMFDGRNLITELRWQRKYLDTGYLSVTQVLFNRWIFDECLKRLEERKVGKWLVKDNGSGGKYVECPFCGALAPCTEFADRTVWKYSKFCYDCGNELRGSEYD